MPPRSSRRTISYNLTDARARAAFEHGLDYHDDVSDDEACNSAALLGTSPNSSSAAQQWRSRPQASAFPSLNNSHRVPGAGALLSGQGSERQTVDMINLLELFPGADRSLVEEVYTGCDCSFDIALDTLSDMLNSKAAGPDPHSADHPTSTHHDTHGGTHGAGTARWDDLPEDVKDIILGMLPTLDVSRAAVTCRDFSRRVRLGAINARVLTIPTGLSLSGIIGMVAGHPNAHTVSLARWGRKGLQDRDFAALLTAISNGSRSSRRNTPVESISLRGWSGLKDGNIMTLCNTLQHLKELDLTECSGLTDASLMELSKYVRAPPPSRLLPAAGYGNGPLSGSAAAAEAEAEEEEEEGTAPAAAAAADTDADLQFELDSGAGDAGETGHPGVGRGGEDGEVEEDEQACSERLEGLALLASSSPPASSPPAPSSLAAREQVALGARPLGWLDGRGKGGCGRAEGSGAAAGAAGGWVGSWDRRGEAAVGAAAPRAAGRGLPPAAGRGLRSLVLAGCAQVSAEGVRALLAAASVKASLEALDVSRCPRMTRMALQIPPVSCLRVLKCAGCNNLHEVIIQLPPTCPLTELHLNNCKHLTKLLLVAPNLKLLHVGGCRSMIAMSLRCTQLAQLIANLCFKWSEVTAEQWLCPRLSHLNLFGARHLETHSLAAILQQSPALKTLNLNGCNTLSTLSISDAHSELSSLDVSGCKGLVSLEVASAGLLEVLAKACPRLQEVRLGSQQLQRLDVSRCVQLQRLQLPALAQQGALLQQQLAGAGPGAEPAAGAGPAVAAAVVPELNTRNSEQLLPGETQLLLRLLKAARRAAAAEARAAGSEEGAAV